jgi:pimeloyl-ACP methyl ester carboxylesterase
MDLPGAGDDGTPLAEVTLDAYADRVCSALAERVEPAVLVGYSMGGVVVTQAAARCPERVARLVYVCAFVPSDGQSLADLTHLPEGADDQIQANMVVEGELPIATLPAPAARDAVFGCCDDEQAARGLEWIGPQAVVPFLTPVALGDGSAFADLPRAYVLCARDRAIPPALQRRMVREAGIDAVVELDTDHAPYLSRTAELAAALDGFARGA